MSERWGVKCATCEKFIDLDGQNKDGEDVTNYIPPLDVVPCPCGSSHLYTSKDVVDEAGVSFKRLGSIGIRVARLSFS